LSAAAYADFYNPLNAVAEPNLPPGWQVDSNTSSPDTSTGWSDFLGSGFSATTFVNNSTKNVVIAFEGTDFGPDKGILGSDGISDIVIGLGLGSSQLVRAAQVYENVLNTYKAQGYTISFTGHSLGAGLASVMSVWFDVPSTVIDVAPFLATIQVSIL